MSTLGAKQAKEWVMGFISKLLANRGVAGIAVAALIALSGQAFAQTVDCNNPAPPPEFGAFKWSRKYSVPSNTVGNFNMIVCRYQNGFRVIFPDGRPEGVPADHRDIPVGSISNKPVGTTQSPAATMSVFCVPFSGMSPKMVPAPKKNEKGEGPKDDGKQGKPKQDPNPKSEEKKVPAPQSGAFKIIMVDGVPGAGASDGPVFYVQLKRETLVIRDPEGGIVGQPIDTGLRADGGIPNKGVLPGPTSEGHDQAAPDDGGFIDGPMTPSGTNPPGGMLPRHAPLRPSSVSSSRWS